MCKIPIVQRVRGFRLYLTDNRRLVDLWLNGGAAILGHTPPKFLRELKNTASRGLYAPFPHFTEGRFIKALLKIFPGYCFRLYAAPPAELAVLFDNGIAKLWRPFVIPENPFAIDNSPLFVPILPGIQTWRNGLPLGLCVIAAKTEELLEQLPPSDPLSPVLLAVAARGIYDILASPLRVKVKMPRVLKALQESRWQRNGIYLSLKEQKSKDCEADQEWTTLFNKFLEAGFLLPSDKSQPLILPGELSPGEEAKLAAILGKDF